MPICGNCDFYHAVIDTGSGLCNTCLDARNAPSATYRGTGDEDVLTFLSYGWFFDDATDSWTSPADDDYRSEYQMEQTFGSWFLYRGDEPVDMGERLVDLLDAWDARVCYLRHGPLTGASIIHMFETNGWTRATIVGQDEALAWKRGNRLITPAWPGMWLLAIANGQPDPEPKQVMSSSIQTLIDY